MDRQSVAIVMRNYCINQVTGFSMGLLYSTFTMIDGTIKSQAKYAYFKMTNVRVTNMYCILCLNVALRFGVWDIGDIFIFILAHLFYIFDFGIPISIKVC